VQHERPAVEPQAPSVPAQLAQTDPPAPARLAGDVEREVVQRRVAGRPQLGALDAQLGARPARAPGVEAQRREPQRRAAERASRRTIRPAPRLRTRAAIATCAAPYPSRRVVIAGASTSLAPRRRSVTSRFTPPKLNQLRCQAVCFMRSGERQSARTSSAWAPARSRARASKGR
jgi:hypothetical protein